MSNKVSIKRHIECDGKRFFVGDFVTVRYKKSSIKESVYGRISDLYGKSIVSDPTLTIDMSDKYESKERKIFIEDIITIIKEKKNEQ